MVIGKVPSDHSVLVEMDGPIVSDDASGHLFVPAFWAAHLGLLKLMHHFRSVRPESCTLGHEQ